MSICLCHFLPLFLSLYLLLSFFYIYFFLYTSSSLSPSLGPPLSPFHLLLSLSFSLLSPLSLPLFYPQTNFISPYLSICFLPILSSPQNFRAHFLTPPDSHCPPLPSRPPPLSFHPLPFRSLLLPSPLYSFSFLTPTPYTISPSLPNTLPPLSL